MSNHHIGEIWKQVEFKTETATESRLEVSNYGRVRTFNRFSSGKIIKGGIINGYPIVRLKLFSARTAEKELEIEGLKKAVRALEAQRNSDYFNAETLQALKKELHEKSDADLRQRTVNYHALIHRLVAEYFLPKPAADQTVVAHLDYDKTNNFYRNLKWMTLAENLAHQQRSPKVISSKSIFQERAGSKLTVTRVMLIKKLLGENKPIKNLAKQFKVTETQIIRIKKGENWGNIEPGR